MARKTKAEYLLGRGSSMPQSMRGKRADLTWKEFQAQIMRLPYMLDLAALNFTVDVAKRALVVFKRSFKEKRFYSSDGASWKPLSKFTIGKRMKRGTWPGKGGVLREYGVLYDSIERYGEYNPVKLAGHQFHDKVWTNPLRFNGSKYHKGFVYAGVHNNPNGDTYGNGFGGKITSRPAVQRQFIGFSTYIDNFENEHIDKYLFHQIFNKGGGGLMRGSEWNAAIGVHE